MPGIENFLFPFDVMEDGISTLVVVARENGVGLEFRDYLIEQLARLSRPAFSANRKR